MPQEIGWRPADESQGGFEVVHDQNPFPTQIIGPITAVPARTIPYAFEQVTVATTSIGLTSSNIEPVAFRVLARLETAQIRFRTDGGAPTTTVGTLLEIGETLELTGIETIRAFRAIRTGSSSGVLDATYEKAS